MSLKCQKQTSREVPCLAGRHVIRRNSFHGISANIIPADTWSTCCRAGPCRPSLGEGFLAMWNAGEEKTDTLYRRGPSHLRRPPTLNNISARRSTHEALVPPATAPPTPASVPSPPIVGLRRRAARRSHCAGQGGHSDGGSDSRAESAKTPKHCDGHGRDSTSQELARCFRFSASARGGENSVCHSSQPSFVSSSLSTMRRQEKEVQNSWSAYWITLIAAICFHKGASAGDGCHP